MPEMSRVCHVSLTFSFVLPPRPTEKENGRTDDAGYGSTSERQTEPRRGFQPTNDNHLLRFSRGRDVVHGLQPLPGCERRRNRRYDVGAISAPGRCAVDSPWLRVRQRIPRHGECRRHGHLYPRSAYTLCRRVVRGIQLPWRLAFEWRRSLRHYYLAPGGANFAGWNFRRICDGVCAAHCGNRVECRHLVPWLAGIELTHADRIDHRCRSRQPIDVHRKRHERCRLVAGCIGQPVDVDRQWHQWSRLVASTRSATRCCSHP